MITHSDVKNSIKQAKPKKSSRPDKNTNIHIKHFGPIAMNALTPLYNKSIDTNTISHIQKTSKRIPILKPNKDKNLSTSYRLIALLSPIAKRLEIIIHNIITSTHTKHLTATWI